MVCKMVVQKMKRVEVSMENLSLESAGTFRPVPFGCRCNQILALTRSLPMFLPWKMSKRACGAFVCEGKDCKHGPICQQGRAVAAVRMWVTLFLSLQEDTMDGASTLFTRTGPPSTMSYWRESLPDATHSLICLRASGQRDWYVVTMKPSRRTCCLMRFAMFLMAYGSFVLYWLMLPQNAMRPRVRITLRFKSSCSPPTFSKTAGERERCKGANACILRGQRSRSKEDIIYVTIHRWAERRLHSPVAYP